MSNELAIQNDRKVSLFDEDKFTHWMGVAQKLSSSDMIPKGYKGKPMDILVAMEMGKQVGLSMMQALQNIAVINGRPSMYGDGVLAVCQSHPSYEYIKEEPIYKGSSIDGYRCIIKRKNHDEHIVVFTKEDAKKANLLGKAGPWSQYESRMLQMRARGFALRNTFPDALQGIQIAEEVQDIQTIEAEWSPKTTQDDRMKSLLNKKGFNNETNTIDAEASDNNNNSITSSTDNGLCDKDSDTSKQTNKTELCPGLAENGESKNSDSGSKNDNIKANESQLESIDFLLHEKSFSSERVHKAFVHFGVKNFAEMSVFQADEMIKILKKAE